MADQFLHQGGGAKNRSRHIVSTVIIAAAKVEEMEWESPVMQNKPATEEN